MSVKFHWMRVSIFGFAVMVHDAGMDDRRCLEGKGMSVFAQCAVNRTEELDDARVQE